MLPVCRVLCAGGVYFFFSHQLPAVQYAIDKSLVCDIQGREIFPSDKAGETHLQVVPHMMPSGGWVTQARRFPKNENSVSA